LTYDDCCLLSNLTLNSERVFYLLERRFKSNSTRTSFDFKSFLPEQPSNNTKVSRSLLRFHPSVNSVNDNEEQILSESSEDEIEETSSPKLSPNDDDDYLNKLAEWEPNKFQSMSESDDDGENEEAKMILQTINNENTLVDPMDLSIGKSKLSDVHSIEK
jgi:hypothetical protein